MKENVNNSEYNKFIHPNNSLLSEDAFTYLNTNIEFL